MKFTAFLLMALSAVPAVFAEEYDIEIQYNGDDVGVMGDVGAWKVPSGSCQIYGHLWWCLLPGSGPTKIHIASTGKPAVDSKNIVVAKRSPFKGSEMLRILPGPPGLQGCCASNSPTDKCVPTGFYDGSGYDICHSPTPGKNAITIEFDGKKNLEETEIPDWLMAHLEGKKQD